MRLMFGKTVSSVFNLKNLLYLALYKTEVQDAEIYKQVADRGAKKLRKMQNLTYSEQKTIGTKMRIN